MNQIPNIEETHNTRESAKKVLKEYYGYKSEQDVPDGLAAVLEDWLHHQLQKAREIENLYNELLQAVEYKHEGETRHQTALRYIQQTELPHLEGVTSDHPELDQVRK